MDNQIDAHNFFILEAQITEQQLDIGFDLYGTGHLIWLAAIIVAGVVISSGYKRLDGRRRMRVVKAFAVVILAAEICKDIILLICGAEMVKYLPFHLCGIAIAGLLADAFCYGRTAGRGPSFSRTQDYGRCRGRIYAERLSGQLIAYAFFPGACAALLFCNWTAYPFFTFMNIYSFAFHGWIVFYFLMRYRGGEIRPTYRGLWQAALIIGLIAIPVYIFNSVAGTNYLFINEVQESSPLVIVWNVFGTRFGQAGYLAGVALMVVLVFHALYVVYAMMGRLSRRKG